MAESAGAKEGPAPRSKVFLWFLAVVYRRNWRQWLLPGCTALNKRDVILVSHQNSRDCRISEIKGFIELLQMLIRKRKGGWGDRSWDEFLQLTAAELGSSQKNVHWI